MNKIIRIALADHSIENTRSLRKTLQQVAIHYIPFHPITLQHIHTYTHTHTDMTSLKADEDEWENGEGSALLTFIPNAFSH